MPGVPSGRACEGCRRQKKKCDEATPICSRCARLGLICIGSGQRRYKFKQDHRFPVPVRTISRNHHEFSREQTTVLKARPSAGPSHPLTNLAHCLVQKIEISTDLKYNLWWAYGSYLEDVPRRLGANEALDVSVHALVSAHSEFCLSRTASLQALAKYSHALNVLRVCLDDPAKACTSETLCAVSLLLICQALIGMQGARWTGHAEGAAQILRARRHFGPRDEFERKLFLALRGPVLFEGLFNSKITLSSQEWKSLVENELDNTTVGGQTMHCLAHIPDIMRRGRRMLSGMYSDPDLVNETRSLYEVLKATLTGLRIQMSETQSISESAQPRPFLPLLIAHYQRLYALALSISIISNRVLSAIVPTDGELLMESTYFSEEIITLAEHAQLYRPLGSACMVICLATAWIGTCDQQLRLLIRKMLQDYQEDFPQLYADDRFMEELGSISDHFNLIS